jgi:tryptophan synthase alpha chain
VNNALDAAFATIRREGRAALIPYLTAGFPDSGSYVDLTVAILDAGADALEIGIPFSDPLLDGPVIQASQQRALDAGVTPQTCLRYAAEIHARTAKPLIFFGAYNPILAAGTADFCREAAASGVSALLVPDIPFEEQDELRDPATAAGMDLIQLVAPTSSDERIRRICALASGFIYCISVAGVTGARSGVAASARPLVERVRACTDLPVVVGFGISGPEPAREVAEFADGVAVGTALVNVAGTAPADERVPAATRFISDIREALEGKSTVRR